MKRGLCILLILMLLVFSAVAYAESADVKESTLASETAAFKSDNADNGSFTEVKNAGFDEIDEDGKLPLYWQFERWAQDDSYMEVVTDDSGNNSLHIVCPSENDVRAEQEIEVKPDTYYKLTCAVTTKGVEGGNGANISVINSPATSDPVLLDCERKTIELTGKTSENQTKITIALRIGGYSAESKGEAWFDDVAVEELKSAPLAFSNFYYENTGMASNGAATDKPTFPHLTEIIILAVFIFAITIVIYFTVLNRKENDFSKPKSGAYALIIMLILGLIIRCVCNYVFTSSSGKYGHSTDISCFTAWGERILNVGPGAFYAEDYFADYPPGYMYVLWLCAAIRSALGIPYGCATHALIFKLPSILLDLFAGYMAYRIAKRAGRSEKTSIILASLIVFNPIFIFLSAVWGQVDIILTVFIVLSLIWLKQGIDKKSIKDLILSGVFFGIATAVKPQALMVGPLYGFAYIMYIIDSAKEKHAGKAILCTIAAAVCALAVIFIPAVPFKGSQGSFWIVNKYIGTVNGYPYASVEAFNFMSLTGGLWKPIDSAFMGSITYGTFGTVSMAIVIVTAFLLYIFTDRKKNGALMLITAFMLSGIFTFGHYMHERYLFPILLLLFLAFLCYNDKRLFLVYGLFSSAMAINTVAAFIIVDNQSARNACYDILMKAGSCITVAAFLIFAVLCIDILVIKHGKARCEAFNSLCQVEK